MPHPLLDDLAARAAGGCELCGGSDDLDVFEAAPDADADHAVLTCATCRGQLLGEAELDPKHWFCLQQSVWSEVPAVQVVAWRQLHRLDESWAAEALDAVWLDDETLAWARAGLPDEEETVRVVDGNGVVLADGDSVTLVKDLDVKGANFTAKRGTLVKGIRLSEDPTHVEGKVNGVAIFLKTEFLKKVG